MKKEQRLRIGIYPGTFDPVHAGHISFALQAQKEAGLDMIYFMPERRPRAKQGVEHFAHRVAMLRRAGTPYAAFDVLEMEDVSFTMQRTLPKLQKRFAGHKLVFLFGSDAVAQLPSWPNAERMLTSCELVVGVRGELNVSLATDRIASWRVRPKKLYVIESYAPEISSSRVREALRGRTYVRGLLTSVARYSNRNWLYISLGKN